MKSFWLCFVPLFVAVDAIGVLPMYMALTEGFSRIQLKRILAQSILTASVVACAFLFVGQGTFRLLGIQVADFMVAGGILLFVISMSNILSLPERSQRKVDPESLGAVPIGVPLIVGPAVLTTILLLAQEFGRLPTVLSTLLNILIAGITFWSSRFLNRILGKAGLRAFSKIANLILAAIAVMIIRKGILSFLGR